MGEFFKNLFITALIVIAATGATAAIGLVASLLTQTPPHEWPAPMALAGTLVAAAATAFLVGALFSIVTLPVAAITMPLVLYPARAMNLPRPVVDIAGGGMAAWLCVGVGLDFMTHDSLRSLGFEPQAGLFEVVGIAAGGFAGYVRWSLFGRGVAPRLIPAR